MRSAESGPIRNVSDTAAWVAVYRAMESERPDALFHDPHARRMSGARGQQIVDALPFGQSMGWSIIVRTAVMDTLINRFLKQSVQGMSIATLPASEQSQAQAYIAQAVNSPLPTNDQLTAGRLFNEGYSKQEAEQWDDAIKAYTEALRLDPAYVEALFLRGRAWVKKGEFDKAIADFDEALRLHPNERLGDALTPLNWKRIVRKLAAQGETYRRLRYPLIAGMLGCSAMPISRAFDESIRAALEAENVK